MSKRPTITDVARIANVSLMSVSRAMNNRPGLSEQTRQHILKIANELGFRPSRIARGLATRRSATIGLCMPDVANPFFSQIARAAEDEAYKFGYSVFLVNTAEDLNRENIMLETLMQQEVDGAILCSPRLPFETLAPYLDIIPATVLVNRYLDYPIRNSSSINIDDQSAARQAVLHFVGQGRKNIGFIGGPSTSVSGARRMEGYQSALIESKIPFDPCMVASLTPDIEGGRLATFQLLSRCPSIDALLCFNDLVAAGAINACKEMQRRVPEDVAVIGVDDIPLASLYSPTISTLRVDLSWIGFAAMSLLMQLIARPSPAPGMIFVQPEFIYRQSG